MSIIDYLAILCMYMQVQQFLCEKNFEEPRDGSNMEIGGNDQGLFSRNDCVNSQAV